MSGLDLDWTAPLPTFMLLNPILGGRQHFLSTPHNVLRPRFLENTHEITARTRLRVRNAVMQSKSEIIHHYHSLLFSTFLLSVYGANVPTTIYYAAIFNAIFEHELSTHHL